MTQEHVDYDQIAPGYNRRYAVNPLPGVRAALQKLAGELSPRRVLEVGCGTGQWLGLLGPLVPQLVGLDLSMGMLRQAAALAAASAAPAGLLQGRAGKAPLADRTFDLVYCVNALHHFDSAPAFLRDALRLLRPGGALAIAGFTPHGRKSDWYVYDAFEGTYETDVRRFPTWGFLVDELVSLGISRFEFCWVEHIQRTFNGREVLSDPFGEQKSTSQLALLTPQAYAQGRRKLETAILAAEKEGRSISFPSNLYLGMLVAHL